jgi:hypothetical protein
VQDYLKMMIIFNKIMARVGVYYKPEERNSENQVIRRGTMGFSQKMKKVWELANFYLSSIFDYLTRKGNMLRREIQYTNLDANFL